MKKTVPLLVMFSIISCKGQEYETERFDLATLSFNLNSEKFYSKSMNRKNIKLSSGKQYVEKDTINEYDLDWEGNKNEIVGIQYNVKSYSPTDTVAFYSKLAFSRLQTMTTEKGKLMLMAATGECSDNDFKSFIQKLTAEFPKPTIEEMEFSIFKTYHYTWITKDKIVQLVSAKKIDFEQSPHNIFTEKDKQEIMEIEKNRMNEIQLYICKPEFEKKLRGKLNSGEYSNFK